MTATFPFPSEMSGLSVLIAEKLLLNDPAEMAGVELELLEDELEDVDVVDDLFELLPHAATTSAAVSARATGVTLLLSKCIDSLLLTPSAARSRHGRIARLR